MKLLDYLFAARPMLLLPAWSIYLVALHYHNELSQSRFSLGDFLILAGITLIAAGAMYLNQIYDQEGDRQNQKLGWLANGYVRPNALMVGFVLTSLLGLAIGALYPMLISDVPYPLYILWIFGQLFVLSFFYSAPPFRLKDRPILGLLANAYGYGMLIAFAVMPEITEHTSYFLGWDNPIYFFATVAGVYLLTTIPDTDGDRSTGKKTVAVWLGPRVTKLLSLAFFLAAAWVALRRGYSVLGGIASIASLLAIATLVSGNGRLVLFAAKLPILLLTLFACWHYPFYSLFLVVLIVATRAYFRLRFGVSYPRLA